MTSKPFTTCLWFDNQGEEAAHYYMSIFKNSRLGGVHPYTEAGPGPAGWVATVEFELNGQRFLALNGGPEYSFTPRSPWSSTARTRPRSTTTGSGCPTAARRSPAAGCRTSTAFPGRSSPRCSST